jgi:hypothetical protein
VVRQLPNAADAVTLDIDDTVDVVHGHHLFNAHYDERCFPPIPVYDTATGRPVVMILRQDAVGQGAPWPFASARPPRPEPLAIDPHHHSRRVRRLRHRSE